MAAFSGYVSDVDFGLVLRDPLEDRDAESVSDLSSSLKASGTPLADRLLRDLHADHGSDPNPVQSGDHLHRLHGVFFHLVLPS